MRKTKNPDGICLTNIIFGWTLIGWGVALVWAVVEESEIADHPPNETTIKSEPKDLDTDPLDTDPKDQEVHPYEPDGSKRLVDCPACGNAVSRRAESCPQCGDPLDDI